MLPDRPLVPLAAATFMLAVAMAGGCDRPLARTPPMNGAPLPAAVEIDLDALDADGLRGPADGKVAVAYEFAIPDTPEMRAAVRRVDPTVEFMPGARGRVGARPGECLCVGSTHQPDHRAVLAALARLPGVTRIVECHHE